MMGHHGVVVSHHCHALFDDAGQESPVG